MRQTSRSASRDERGSWKICRDSSAWRSCGRSRAITISSSRIGRTKGLSKLGPTALNSRKRTETGRPRDRKSTRLNSSHLVISYAVFCLKKKKTKHDITDDDKENNEYN